MFNIHDSDKSSYAGSEYTYWAQIQRHTLKHVDNFYGAGGMYVPLTARRLST